MTTGFEKLQLISSTIANMEQLGFPITNEIERKRKEIEEEIVQKELLPLLHEQIEPIVGWFSKNFVIVVDYDPSIGLAIKLSQKKRFTDVNLPTAIDQQDLKYSPKRTGDYSVSKSPSSDAYSYALRVPELKALAVRPFITWKEICEHLHVDVVSDSARRKLKRWVEDNRPLWPKVPEVNQ